MTKLPRLTSRELCKIVESLGFVAIRQRGSHRYFRHLDGRTAVVPIHDASYQIGRGLLKKILDEIKINREEFLKLYYKK